MIDLSSNIKQRLMKSGKKVVLSFDIPDMNWYWATYEFGKYKDVIENDGFGGIGQEVDYTGGLANVDSILLDIADKNDTIISKLNSNIIEGKEVNVYLYIIDSFDSISDSDRIKIFSGEIDNYEIDGSVISFEITHRSLIESESICEESAKGFVKPIIYINSRYSNNPFYQPSSSSPISYLNKLPCGFFHHDRKYFYYISKNNPNTLKSVWVKTDNGFDEVVSSTEIKNIPKDEIEGGGVTFKSPSLILGVNEGYFLEVYGEDKKIQARRNNFVGSLDIWKEMDNIESDSNVDASGTNYLFEEYKFDKGKYFMYGGSLLDGEKMVLRVNMPKFDLDVSNRDIYYKINFDPGSGYDPYYSPDVKLKIQSKLMSDGVTLNEEGNFLADDRLRKISNEPHNHGNYVDIFLANDSGSEINFSSKPLNIKLIFERFTYDREVDTSENLCITTDSQYNKLDSILENLMSEEIGYNNFNFVNSNRFPNLSTYFNTTKIASEVVNDISDKNCVYSFYDNTNKLKLLPIKKYEDLEFTIGGGSPTHKDIFVDNPHSSNYKHHGIKSCRIEKTSLSEIINNINFKYGYDPIEEDYTEYINIKDTTSYEERTGSITSRYVSKDTDAQTLSEIKFEKLKKPAYICSITTTLTAIAKEIGDVINIQGFEAKKMFPDTYDTIKWVIISKRYDVFQEEGLIEFKAYYIEG